MHAQLARLTGEYQSALDRLHAMQRSIPAAVWARRPVLERWSPAECVAHLVLTSAAFVPLLHNGLAEARRLGGAVPARYRRDGLGWLIAKLSGPTRLFRTRTTPAFVPAADRQPAELVAEFERLQADHLACLRDADGVPLHTVKISSPFDARIRYTLYSAFAMIPGHQHRHLAQAEEAAAPRGARARASEFGGDVVQGSGGEPPGPEDLRQHP